MNFKSHLRPSGSPLASIFFTALEPEWSYADELTISGESELSGVIRSQTARPPAEEEKAKILPVTNQKTSQITKEFSKLDVGWQF